MNKIIKLDTPNTSMVFTVHKDRVALTHYGALMKEDRDFSFVGADPFDYSYGGSNDHYSPVLTPISYTDDGNATDPLVIIKNAECGFVNRFLYSGHRYKNGGDESCALPSARQGLMTLVIEYKDENAGLRLNQYYTVFSDCDVIAVRQRVFNDSKKPVSVRRLMSLQIDVNGVGHKCVSFHGAWGRERFRKETEVNAGSYELQSLSGLSSAHTNPFFMLEKRSGGILAFNLVYSGNHREIIEAREAMNDTRVLVGINDYCLDWTIQPGDSFETPQAIVVYAETEQEITRQMHEFSMKHIVDPEFADKERPVLLNNWEGTAFNFDEQKLLALADRAAAIGVELFVLDDGWFGHRDDDTSSLGDWYDYDRKLNGGLGQLADKIRARGLEFGIWVEPEMISEDSDLFRAHPDYAMTVPGLDPIRRRNQLMLDLANPKVREYIVREISSVIDRCHAYYVKWDCNRFVTEAFSKSIDNLGEYYHRYVLGLYEILGELKSRYPKVLFESCASGGSRFDLGMLYYMPQCWCSDLTDPIYRTLIQEGTLCGYPQSSIGAHVTAFSDISYETKFNVACLGAFGYELDLCHCSDDDLETMKKQIEYYKKHRRLLQFGRYYSLESAFSSDRKNSWIIFSQKGDEAIAYFSQRYELFNGPPAKWRLCGFDNDAVYSVEVRPQSNLKEEYVLTGKARGDMLNSCELCFKDLFKGEIGYHRLGSTMASRLVYFKKIGK